MSYSPTGNRATPAVPYINAVNVTSGGLVTQVSFYADNTCDDSQIYFGAFEALSPLLSSAQFQLVTQSGAISVNLSGTSSSLMQLVVIPLCIFPSIPVGCQATAFVIDQGQYFGSYASQCHFGFSPVGPTDYPRTYYKYSYNPFTSTTTSAIYSNSFSNVVLQEITIAELTTGMIIFTYRLHLNRKQTSDNLVFQFLNLYLEINFLI
jgi:hypothetical protein